MSKSKKEIYKSVIKSANDFEQTLKDVFKEDVDEFKTVLDEIAWARNEVRMKQRKEKNK